MLELFLVNLWAVLLRNADYKCLQLFCCLKLIYLASSLISLLFPHFTWFYFLSCPSMALTCGCVTQKWNQACSHRRCVLLSKLSNLNYWERVHFPVPVTLLPFSDGLIDWLIHAGEWVVPWHTPECSLSSRNSSMASQW